MEKEKNKFALYDKIGQPKFICAPMVDQSELCFRMLCRKYGTTLCYTPMLHSRMSVEDKNYLDQMFTTCKEDRPLFVQFCGNDPDTIVAAAKLVEDRCDAVDINLGCPQGIARKGHYGSFLLEETDLIVSMVKKMKAELKVPVTCKIRILQTEEKTMNLVRKIVDAGCALLTVHGRTKEQNKQKVGKCDWEIIKKIKESVDIPVYANGGVYNYQDALQCMVMTGVDGVMSSEALLENPGLFSGEVIDQDRLALEYLELARIHKPDHAQVRAHMFKMLYPGVSVHTDLRDKLVQDKTYDDFEATVKDLQKRRKDVESKDKLGWYLRYMPGNSKECYNDYLLAEKGITPNGLEDDNKKQKEADEKEKPDVLDSDNFLDGAFDEQ